MAVQESEADPHVSIKRCARLQWLRTRCVWLGVLGFLLVRGVYLWAGGRAVDADEAIVGLMARDILRGGHVVYYWGQTYMGSLEAYTASVFFLFLPAVDWVLKLAPMLHALLMVWMTQKFLEEVWPEIEARMIWIPGVFSAPFFLEWSLKARGGYMLTLLFGMMIFWLGMRMILERTTLSAADGSGRLQAFLRLLGVLLLVILGMQLLFGGFAFRIFGQRIGNSTWWKPLVALGGFWGGLMTVARYRPPRALWESPITRYCAGLGLVAGLSWWTNALVIFYWVPLGVVLGVVFFPYFRSPRNLLWFIGVLLPAFFVGSFPMWLHQWRAGAAPMGEVVETGVWRHQLAGFFQVGVPRLFGIFVRGTPSTPEGIRDGVLAGVLLCSLCVFLWLWGRRLWRNEGTLPQKIGPAVVLFFLLLTPFMFSLSSFGDFVKEPRYLLPYYWVAMVPVAVSLGWLWRWKKGAGILLICIWAGATARQWTEIEIAHQQPVVRARRLPVDFSPLLALLYAHKIEAVWADYWIAYRITFETQEQIIAAPYPPGVNDRQPRYFQFVEGHAAPAYIIPTSIYEGFVRQLEREGRTGEFRLELMPPFAVFLPQSEGGEPAMELQAARGEERESGGRHPDRDGWIQSP